MKQLFLSILTSLLFLSSCANERNAPLVGLWTGTNEQGEQVQIEFSPDGYYLLFVDGRSLTTSIAGSGHIRYEILQEIPSLQVALIGEKDKASFGKLSASFHRDDQLTLSQLSAEDKPEPEGAILLKKIH